MVGAAIGRHQTSKEVVCFDHINWFLARFLANPSMLIVSKPGLGKSTLAARIMLALAAQGYILLVPGDTKPDYVELVRALGGEVRSVSRVGGAAFNPCDPGGMVSAGIEIGGEEGFALIGEAIARATTLLAALLELSRPGTVADYEESVIGAALAHLYETGPVEPVIDDLIGYISERPQQLRDVLLTASSSGDYDALTKPLMLSLKALIDGVRFGDVFSRRTTRSAGGRPNALNIDTSAIKGGNPAFLAAVLMASWADIYGQVEADQARADAGLAPRRLYCLTLDELWRVLNLGGTLPDRVNELTRLNRTQGVGQIMITHSVKDLTKAGSADGIAERAGAIVIGGVPSKEILLLEDVVTLTRTEKDEIKRWLAISRAHLDSYEEGDTPSLPPGGGKFLIKASPDDPGIPVDVVLSSVELAWGGQNTNKVWDAA
jgi:hypothetical protein